MNSTKQTHYYYACAFVGNEHEADIVVAIKESTTARISKYCCYGMCV